MKSSKENLVIVAGNISSVDIRESQTKTGEFFGNISVAYDDGYFDKNNNNEWVERVFFFEVKMSNHAVKQVKTLNVGDQISIKGKLVVEKWVDDSQKNRQAMKVSAEKIISHITKAEIEILKANTN